MSYGRFRTGCNQEDVEGREIAKIHALEKIARVLEDTHDWQCDCGHWNGPNLATCAQCNRRPGER